MLFQRLKDLWEDLDLQQEDVAEVLGSSQTVYSSYKRGFQTIPVIYLLKLAAYYKVSTDYILGRTNNSKSYDVKLNHISTPKFDKKEKWFQCY